MLSRCAPSIEDWLADMFSRQPAVLTTSVDLRSSGYKLAPVDVNFFPAGYNNLGESAQRKAEAVLLHSLSQYAGCKVLVVVESHTRNKKYIDSVIVLMSMLCNVGFAAEVGACGIESCVDVLSSNGTELRIKPIVRSGDTISTSLGFTPDLVILNNDLTSGIPQVLSGHLRQKVMPPACLGWFNRRKSRHFRMYERVVSDFCQEFGLDPWCICALFECCEGVDFVSRKCIDHVAEKVESLISQIKEKFRFYGINDTPHVFIKADNGTYGMGVVEVYSGENVLNLNKKDRNKMRRIKENNPVENVVLQEGIPSSEVFCSYVAEPLLYYIMDEPVCYLYRYNAGRSKVESLNVPGCGFFDVGDEVPEIKRRVWRLVSKLAVIASAMEAAEIIEAAPVHGKQN